MRKPTFELLQAKNGRWYWHLKAVNGRIVDWSGQTFSRSASAKRAALRVIELSANADIVRHAL